MTFDDAPFQDLPVVPEIPFAIALDLQENRIVIGTARRGESAETLAAWMEGSMTQSIFTYAGWGTPFNGRVL